MPYERPDVDEVKRKMSGMTAAFEKAESLPEAIEAYMAADNYIGHIDTMASLASIRNSMDTTDDYYDAEKMYFDEVEPLLREMDLRFQRALLNSPHRAGLEAEFGSLMFRNIEIKLKTFDPAIIPDLQRENKLITDYDKLLASAQIAFGGKTLTLAQVTPYLEDADRDVRRAACDARSAWFMERAGMLDSLYDELVQLRDGMAKKLGFKNFIELGYCRMTRNCYNMEMVERFRKGVREHVVPLAARLKKEQAARIGVSGIKMYDDALVFAEGNAKPYGTPDEIFGHGRKMYRELSGETGEFIDFMLENELFDVLTRPGKSGGGYCCTLPDYKSAFIFANFNGTSGDIDVLTHEAGHAFNSHMLRERAPSPLRGYTSETAEVHSMGMEFFTWPWMEGFFHDAGKYRRQHLAGALTFIPSGTMVDEFQHKVYENPGLTPGGRNRIWKELEGIYRPWLDLEETPFFEEGRRWQYQLHIYELPFYYIDYCLAQTVALALWAEDREDHAGAWDKYLRFIACSGKMTFTESLEACGLPGPFEPENINALISAAGRWLQVL
jgi:M3 family oligoendopeptidase